MSRAGTCHPNRSTGTSPVVVAKRQLRGTKLPGADLAYGQFLSCSSMGIAIAMVKRVKPWILYPYGPYMAHIVILGMSGTIAIHAPIFPTIMFWLLTMAPLTMRKSTRQSVASTKWKQECRLHVVIAEAPSRWPSPVIWVEREQLIKKTSNSSNCVQDILIHCKMLVPFCYWMLLNDALPYVQKVDLLDFGMFQGTAQKLAISM